MTSSATNPTPSIAQLFDLNGKVAIVTGGALGIGQAIAYRLAEAGAAVLISDINIEAARETVAQIAARGGTAGAIRADTSSASDARAVAEEAVRTFGRLDILVNNAGIFPFAPALDMTEAQWDKVLDVNLKGAFLYAQAAARQMVAGDHGGRIINIASIDGLHPTGNLAHYDSSKGGMVMLTKALALEFGRRGIAVNAIAPGSVNTPGARSAGEALARAENASVEEMSNESFTARIPLGRSGEPDDIARVALFLASAAADYITGDVIVVDGGYLLS
ncbi:MAG: Oxidoreductase, short-chain dehydrogenase/reductase family [Ktedonobacterales bacterium]|nr:MAG: Oxidoreductase, short-chain dehydrogenase/reductase family [Ktedonobacterales bacterium]